MQYMAGYFITPGMRLAARAPHANILYLQYTYNRLYTLAP